MPEETGQVPEGNAAAAAIPHPACPRCGYDLSAATFGWSETCPLGGQCSECGLEFGWREILRPDAMPWWWIEGARGFRQMLVALVALPFVSIAANRLFRKIRLGQEGRPWRLWLCLVLPILLIHTFGVASSVASLFRVAASDQLAPLSTIGALESPSERTTGRTLANLVVALPQAAFPIGAEVWLPFCDAGGTAFGYDPWTGVPRPPAPRPSYVGPAWAPWAAGVEYSRALLGGGLVSVPSATVILPVCSALTFAALPVSRRRAKVQAIHVVRCTVAAIATMTALVPALVVLVLALERFRVLASVGPVVLLPAIGLGFLVLWWHVAIRDYLRVSNSFAVAFAIVTVGTLATPVVLLAVGSAVRALAGP